jgi:hypothetical protein
MRDTRPEADQLQLDALRAMAPGARIRLALDLSETMRQLALSRLRVRYPDRSDVELVEIMLGLSSCRHQNVERPRPPAPVVAQLNAAGIPFMLTGSVAAAARLRTFTQESIAA